MDENRAREPADVDDVWRNMLLNSTRMRRSRRIHNRIPSAPRCKMCAAPFGGVGGMVMPVFGHARWPKNPKYCAGCFAVLRAHHGGAEVDCSLLFADVRGSTRLAEQMRPRDFNRLMGRFYDVAFAILVDHDAVVDKFVGDEIIGIFVPSMAGAMHARQATDAAQALLRATGHADRAGPWVPVGVGVGSGIAYVGAIGEGTDLELTAMGDLVNTTARLSSVAGAGEIIVTAGAAMAAEIGAGLEHRALELKGKTDAVEVVVLRA